MGKEYELSNRMKKLRELGAVQECLTPLCRNKVLVGDKYCEDCKSEGKVKEVKVNRDSIYNKYKRDKKSTAFYNSKEWRGVKGKRNEIIRRDKGKCQRCKRLGYDSVGEVVHHIIPLREDWDLRLDSTNLEVLCHDCHNKAHGRLSKG